ARAPATTSGVPFPGAGVGSGSDGSSAYPAARRMRSAEGERGGGAAAPGPASHAENATTHAVARRRAVRGEVGRRVPMGGTRRQSLDERPAGRTNSVAAATPVVSRAAAPGAPRGPAATAAAAPRAGSG